MRPVIVAAVLFVLTNIGLTNVALADVEVGPPPPDAASSSSGGGGGCSAVAGEGSTEGALVFATLGAVGLISVASRRRRSRR